MTEETKTKFKGPGEWRSQARRLERGDDTPKRNDTAVRRAVDKLAKSREAK